MREESDDDAAPRGRRGGVVAEASCRLVWRGARHVYARDVTDTATTLSAPAGGRCQASRAPHAPRHESFEWHCAISLVVALQKCHPRPSQNGGPGRSEGGSSHWTRIDPRSGHAAHNGTVGDHAAPWRHRRTVGRAWRPPRPPRGCDAALATQILGASDGRLKVRVGLFSLSQSEAIATAGSSRRTNPQTHPPRAKYLSYEDADNIFRLTDPHFVAAELVRIAIRGRLPLLGYGRRFRLWSREARSYERAMVSRCRQNQLSRRVLQLCKI